MTEEEPTRFSSALPVIVYTRPMGSAFVGAAFVDWQEFDCGPGYFTIPAGMEVRVRLKGIDDNTLVALIRELESVAALRYLDLSENRNITNEGLRHLPALKQITGLNLNSCSITSSGLEYLRGLTKLVYLNLSYCNRLTDSSLKTLEAMRNLTYVDLQSCLSITKAAFSRVRRRDLTIYRG